MTQYLPAIGVILLAAAVVLISAYLLKNKAGAASGKAAEGTGIILSEGAEIGPYIEELSSLSEYENERLVEITDRSILARVDSAIPGLIQIAAFFETDANARDAAKEMGTLYKVIIPKGTHLAKSRDMENAARGFFHGKKGVKGHANLVKADPNMARQLGLMEKLNAVMGIASYVVGQYYMSQINRKLGEINEDLNRISGFQDNEFKGKILTLITEIRRISDFRIEIMENDEQRKRELDHLKDLETRCMDLIGHAVLTIKEYAERKSRDFNEYESLVYDVQKWYDYQRVLLDILYKIADLTYALNMGAVSRENSYASASAYTDRVRDACQELRSWHWEARQRYNISVLKEQRERKGLEKAAMAIPAIFNGNLNYKNISSGTVDLICAQSSDEPMPLMYHTDPYREDIQLIVKDGKTYYLPKQNPEANV